MANRHYGNLADVFKHLALGEMLETLRPSEYWESHAGTAITDESPEGITPERLHGVHYFHAVAGDFPELALSCYFRILRRHRVEQRLTRIPGSPALAHELIASGVRRCLFCDTDAPSLQSIRRLGANIQTIECVQDDGILILRGACMLLPDQWAATTLAFIDPQDIYVPSGSGISPLELWCELANRGIRSVLWYGFDNEMQRTACHERLHKALATARILSHGIQRFEGSLRVASEPKPPTQWGFGLLTMNLPGPTLERVDAALRALEAAYVQAPLPLPTPPSSTSPPGTGAWTYSREWM